MKQNEIIGKRIKLIRTQKCISQDNLAKAADVTTNYIGQIERGQQKRNEVYHRTAVAQRLARFFFYYYHFFSFEYSPT